MDRPRAAAASPLDLEPVVALVFPKRPYPPSQFAFSHAQCCGHVVAREPQRRGRWDCQVARLPGLNLPVDTETLHTAPDARAGLKPNAQWPRRIRRGKADQRAAPFMTSRLYV